jgi:hypothetical protein
MADSLEGAGSVRIASLPDWAEIQIEGKVHGNTLVGVWPNRTEAG